MKVCIVVATDRAGNTTTVEFNIISEVQDNYIIKDNYLLNVWQETTLTDFKNNYTSQEEYYTIKRNDTELTDTDIIATGDTIEFGKWYFLVMKFDAITQSFAMYLDGILVDTKTTPANPIPDTAPARTISVGYFNGTTAYDTGVIDGVVDELGIWSRALSDAEVSELYNNGAGKFL